MPAVVGDVGSTVSIDVKVDVSSATSAVMVFRAPSGAASTKTASASGTSVQYSLVSGDLDESGVWALQAWVTMPGWSGYSKPVELRVFPRLADAEA